MPGQACVRTAHAAAPDRERRHVRGAVETRVGHDMETDRLARCTQAVRGMALPHYLDTVNRCMIRH